MKIILFQANDTTIKSHQEGENPYISALKEGTA